MKSSLDDKGQYEKALGQASDRAQLLFQMQAERKWVIVAVLGSSSMEVLRLTRYPDQDRIKRTGLMTLTEDKNALDPNGSQAARSILQLFFAAKQDFDFKPPFLPPPFTLKKRLDVYALDKFECLRTSDQQINIRSAYKAIMKSGKYPVGVPVVVKFGKKEDIDTDVSVLELLSNHNIPSTPRLFCDGQVPGIGSCLVIGPVGCLIGAADIPPIQIAQVALDIVTAILALNNVGILHCDVSAGNVLVTADGRGLLVDYGSSLQGMAIGSRRVTGKQENHHCEPANRCIVVISLSGVQGQFYSVHSLSCGGTATRFRRTWSPSFTLSWPLCAMARCQAVERPQALGSRPTGWQPCSTQRSLKSVFSARCPRSSAL